LESRAEIGMIPYVIVWICSVSDLCDSQYIFVLIRRESVQGAQAYETAVSRGAEKYTRISI